MNKTFKVARSLTRGTVVTSEKASSYQGKAVKTVIAAAAAMMMAGGAMAAATAYTDVTVNEGATVVYENGKITIKGTTATGKKGSDQTATAITDGTEVTFSNQPSFKGGAIVVNAGFGKTEQITQGTAFGTAASQIEGNIAVNAYQGAGQDAYLNMNEIGISVGEINFGINTQDSKNDTAADKVTTGTATLVAGNINLGTAGDAELGLASSQVAVKNAAGLKATLQAGANANLTNVALTNAGELTVSGTSIAVGAESTIANTGVLSLKSTGAVALAADYDGKSGYLNVEGDAVTVTGDITGDYVKIGEVVALTDGKPTTATEKNTIGIKGTTSVQIGKATNATDGKGSLVVGKTLEIAGNFTNATKVEAPATEVTATSATVTNDTYGTMSLGDLTIADQKSLTLMNSNKKSAVGVNKLTLDGTFEVSAGNVEIAGAGSKIDKGTLNIGATGVLTLSGDLTNNKTIGFTADGGKLVIDGSLDNAKTATLGNANTSGAVAVNGTLSNKGSIAVKDITVAGKLSNLKSVVTADAYTGKVTASTVKVEKGGVVESAIATDSYVVDTTTVEEGGAFITSLNAKITADNDSLSLGGKSFVLNGGVLGTAADAPVTKFNLGASDSLTLNGEYALDTVKQATGAAFNVGNAATDKTGNVTVKTLDAVANGVTVNGSLCVTDSLSAEASSINVGEGTLTTSLKAMNLEVNSTTGAIAAIKDKTKSVTDGFLTLGQNGTLALDLGSDKLVKTSATTLKNLLQTQGGLIDVGAVDLYTDRDTAIAVTNGEIKLTDLAGFEGITTDTLKSSRITGVGDTITSTASYGAVELAKKSSEDTGAAGLTVDDNVTLTLSGMGDTAVNLVQYADDKVAGVTLAGANSTLVTKGNGVIGAVTGQGIVNVAENTLTVQGNLAAGEVSVDETATLTIGEATTPYTVKVTNLTVDGAFNAAANTVEATNLKVTGTADVKELTVTDGQVLGGSVTVAKLAAGTTTIGNWNADTKEDVAGTLAVTELASGTIEAKKSYDQSVNGTVSYGEWTAPATSIAVKSAAAGTQINVDQNAYVALGTTDTTAAQKALTAAGFTLAKTVDTNTTDDIEVSSIDTRTVNSVVYVDGGKSATTDAKAYLGAVDTTNTVKTRAAGGVNIADNSALVFDTATVDTTGTTALFGQDLNLAHDAVVIANNLKVGDKVLLTAGTLNDSDFDWESVQFTGDILSYADADKNNVLTVSMYDKTDLQKMYGLDSSIAGFDAAYSYFANSDRGTAATSSAKFTEWLYTRGTSAGYGTYSDGTLDVMPEVIKSIANAAGALGATTGVQTMTMDAVAQMADTVADRTSVLTQRGQGVNVWADVNGGKFEAKTLFDGAGYSSDIYSGVLGLDYQFSCNAVLGAALTIGTADTDSKNTAFKASTDSDLVGFSVYASKTFGDIWNVSADIGYLQASNEVKADGYGFNYKFDQDTDAFTFGVRGEVLTKAGSVNIVPHVGLRYTALSTDGFEAAYVTDIDDQNIFQMPVGVTVSADFETSGWTIAPKFDLSVVPTFGDKDADLKLGVTGASATSDYSVRVIDSNPVQAQLGVNATNGAWGFGLNYKLGVGSDDRMNNSFNANVRYAF